MRRMNRFITALLIVLSFAGAGLAAMFLKHENELAVGRQEKLRKLTEELQPVNEKRKELQNKDKEWQKTLEDEKKGKPCVMLCFNTMDDEVYYTMYDMMDQYGFRGTFVLKDGHLPGYSEDSVTGEEVSEMIEAGWEYALAEETDLQKGGTDELSILLESETETEEAAEMETVPDETETGLSWIERLDEHLGVLEAQGMSKPFAVLCTKDQYSQTSAKELANRGLQTVCILNEEEFPAIEESEEGIPVFEAGLYTQNSQKMEEAIDHAVQNKNSIAVCINSVVKISEDAGYDLSVTRFSSLLNKLKGLEEQGEIYVLTFSEYNQCLEQQEKAYQELLTQYAKFRQDMNEQIKELDEREESIVDSLKNEETEAQGIWKIF